MKLKKDSVTLILMTLIFLGSCIGQGSDFGGVLAPDYPNPPSFSLSPIDNGWRIEHHDKVALQRWILELDGFQEDCRTTIEELGK
jgi:hypothetical protein